MALDYTVIVTEAQRFGDNVRDEKATMREREVGLQSGAPTDMSERSFAFRCPNVNRNEAAVLLFRSFGVSANQAIEINGQAIQDGLTPSIDAESRRIGGGSDAHQDRSLFARWHGGIALIPRRVLREDNVLRIRAVEMTLGNVDDFLLDNLVVVFKQGGGVFDPGLVDAVVTALEKRARKKPAKAPKRRR